MVKKRIRGFLPHPSRLTRDSRLSRLFGKLLHDVRLWHLNRNSVASAVSVGLFMAFVPVPFQMVLAAAAAVVLGCNLPIAVAVVWVSNPVTMPPLFYAAYKVGAALLDIAPSNIEFEISFAWLMRELAAIWQPLLLGCFTLGLAAAAIGHIAVRLLWRLHVLQSWRQRRARRGQRKVTVRSGGLEVDRTTLAESDEAPPRP